MHAHALDGLDFENREEIDRIITASENGAAGDDKAKARRERAAVEAALSRKG